MTIKFRRRQILIFLLFLYTALILQYSSKALTPPQAVKNIQISSTTDELIVHYLDIGRADCILIQEPNGHTILIDGGNESDSMYIQSYLFNLGIRKIDVLIATHPHEDHIGSIDDIIYTFEIGKIYAPKVSYDSSSHINFINSIAKKGYEIIYASAGDHFRVGDANFQILSPSKDKYASLNNYSLVTKLNFGNVSFLLMADAQGKVLNEIMDSGYPLKSDVIKIGHHGDLVSTPLNFLREVNPHIAVISVRNNSYNHPHLATLSNLYLYNVETYLTAGKGTVVMTTDGEEIKTSRSIYMNTDKESLSK